MKIVSRCRVDHRCASAIDLPHVKKGNVSLIIPGASSCTSFGCCSSCSTAAVNKEAA